MKKTAIFTLITILFYFLNGNSQILEESFDPITSETVPQNFDELWQNYDPREEPLDTEVLYEWEEDDVVFQVIRYRVGVFKGEKAMVAAIYGYPKGQSDLPGLVQVHGGGQFADYRAVSTNAKRGYATISIAWAGRINSPGYRVNQANVELFWAEDFTNSAYMVTTDWGAMDGYHASSKYPEHNNPGSLKPAFYTLDDVESPRNSSWFLWTLAARRALTFLENQEIVNADKLGIYGHSMGGKITILTATDSRVKAAAPSCGGISDIGNQQDLYHNTISDDTYLPEITCPVIFLSPTNDFHGKIGDLSKAVDDIQNDEWRVASAPQHNHQDLPASEVTALLWMEKHLKDNFNYPETPECTLQLNTLSNSPKFTLSVDNDMEILSVDVYYTQQVEPKDGVSDSANIANRFWHHSKALQNGNQWEADIALTNTDKELWAYANIVYALEEPVSGAGYYYRTYNAETFNVSSLMRTATVEELEEAGSIVTLQPTTIIESFQENWEKEWYTYSTTNWDYVSHKVYDDIWTAPQDAELVLNVRSEQANKMVIYIGNYAKELDLIGENEWQQFELSLEDFENAIGVTLPSWQGIFEIALTPKKSIRTTANGQTTTKVFGDDWQGEIPEFQSLSWKSNFVQSPYALHQIPGVIEAEEYDYGGEGISYHDITAVNHGEAFRPNERVDLGELSDGEYYLGWNLANEWVEYTVNVSETADYDIELLTSSINGLGTLHFELDDVPITTSITVENTGSWNQYQNNVINSIQLTAGVHVLKLYIDEAGLNLDKFEFKKSDIEISTGFTPDPNKVYYIDAPHHNLRLAADGESEDAYTTSTSTTGANVEWQFVSKGNGSWHIQRAAGGANSRLRTDNTEFADMQPTGWNGVYTYYNFSTGSIANTYFLTLPDGPSEHQRLQINTQGLVRFMPTSHAGTWESFRITEAGSVTNFERIQAENHDAMSGVSPQGTSDVGGGENLGWINNGDWILFEDIDLTGAQSVDMRIACNFTGGIIEVRTGSVTGTLICEIDVNNTGGNQNWVTLGANLRTVSGVQDVYLVFTGGSGYLYNINWLEFSS